MKSKILNNKIFRTVCSVLIVLFTISFLEGSYKWLGLIGLIVFSIVMAAKRIYNNRESIKILFNTVGTIAELNKNKNKNKDNYDY